MQLLWPTASPPDFGVCSHCGTRRDAELQLMAPLWHFVEECIPWYEQLSTPVPEGLATAFLQHPEWDWVTVAVGTCPKSCHVGHEAWSVVKESCVGFNLMRAASKPPKRLEELSNVLSGPGGDIGSSLGGSGIAKGSLGSVAECCVPNSHNR
jgi:hypothetical protein